MTSLKIGSQTAVRKVCNNIGSKAKKETKVVTECYSRYGAKSYSPPGYDNSLGHSNLAAYRARKTN